MTPRKYYRLALVSILPLLLMGVAISVFAFPYPRDAYMLCRPSTDLSACFVTTNFDRIDAQKEFWSGQGAWFQVDDDKNTHWHLRDVIEAGGRGFRDAKIIQAEPYLGTTEKGMEVVKALPGKTAYFGLGIKNGQRSILTPENLMIACNSLDYLPTPDSYASLCFGEDWVAQITYTIPDRGGEAYKMMQSLKAAITEARDQRRFEFLAYQILVYPSLVYAFFLISGIVWLVMMASRYVRSG
ncbi:hypothetical protein AMC83_PA00007 (plasmid) [Rhizobium phaseoli]|uniref:hypothetical protein n=1 Tax=Rhizobium phaseoli TaxID=396 RepID=UPI0007EA4792|nr:hypothetical protein [Rhizobium phaseoli]ANL74234.1 hypothetical protein AMC83_PA00007 [Rhizobium phaseoli]